MYVPCDSAQRISAALSLLYAVSRRRIRELLDRSVPRRVHHTAGHRKYTPPGKTGGLLVNLGEVKRTFKLDPICGRPLAPKNQALKAGTHELLGIQRLVVLRVGMDI
eukprot:6184481-Pleurochrysis_carterae.AAC.1